MVDESSLAALRRIARHANPKPMIRTSSSPAPAPSPRPAPSGDRSGEAAESLAIEALGFLAADPELLSRFLAITGIEASEIRAAASQKGFLAGVLSFVAAHEPTLMAFATGAGKQPQAVLAAMRALPGGSDSFERSA